MGPAENRQAPRQMVGMAVYRLLDRGRVDHVFRRRADIGARFLVWRGGARCVCDGRHIDRNNLHLRRFHARTAVHLYVPVAANPDCDDGRKVVARDLQGMAWGKARQFEGGASRSGCIRRLYRLQPMCRCLPDRYRYSRRAADRLHHLRIVYRRLRQCHGANRQAARTNQLLHIGRCRG